MNYKEMDKKLSDIIETSLKQTEEIIDILKNSSTGIRGIKFMPESKVHHCILLNQLVIFAYLSKQERNIAQMRFDMSKEEEEKDEL